MILVVYGSNAQSIYNDLNSNFKGFSFSNTVITHAYLYPGMYWILSLKSLIYMGLMGLSSILNWCVEEKVYWLYCRNQLSLILPLLG